MEFQDLICSRCKVVFNAVDYENYDGDLDLDYPVCVSCASSTYLNRELCGDCDKPATQQIAGYPYCDECAEERNSK